MSNHPVTASERARRSGSLRIAVGAVAAAAVLSLTGLLPAQTAHAAPGDLVAVPDANFKACINDALGQAAADDITEGQASGVTEVDCQHRGVGSIVGAEFLTGLTSLNIFDNDVSDLAPLSNLSTLDTLTATQNEIVDVADLSGLTTLTQLNLSYNDIVDVSELSGLTSLERLYLAGNDVAVINGLSGMTALSILDLAGNAIEDVSSLPAAASMSTLVLQDNQIVDVAPLAQLDSLVGLRLGGNAIEDVAPLSGLSSLRYLHLQDNSIHDLSALATMTNDFIDVELTGQSYDLGNLEIDVSVPNPVRDVNGDLVDFSDPRGNADGTFTPTGSPGQASPLPWNTTVTVGQTGDVEFSGELTFEQVSAEDPATSPEITSIEPDTQFTVCDAPTRISGTAEPGTEFDLALLDLTDYHAGTGQQVLVEEFSPPVDAEGNWSVDMSDPLSRGDYAVGIRESGDELFSSFVAFTVTDASCDGDNPGDGDSDSGANDDTPGAGDSDGSDGGSDGSVAGDSGGGSDVGTPGSDDPGEGTGADSAPDRLPETGAGPSPGVLMVAAALLLMAGTVLGVVHRRRIRPVAHSRHE